MSTLSIIVPIYNAEKYLSDCIDSILSQTFTDFELILVDDGSLDSSPEICDNYAKKDKRIIVIHKENNGASSARNTGLDWFFANSDSKYIGFVDSDDMIHPQMYEFLLRAITETNSQIAICDVTEQLTEEFYKEKTFELIPDTEKNSGMFNHWNRLAVWDRLWQREIFKEIRFPLGKICEDRAIFVPLHYNKKMVRVCADLYYYRTVEMSVSRDKFSLKNLDVLWSIKERILHLNKIELHGKERLLEMEVKKFCKYSEIYYYRLINELNALNEAEKVKEDLKKTFDEYRKIFTFPKDEFIDCYLLLYPFSAKIYLYKTAIFNKVKKILK